MLPTHGRRSPRTRPVPRSVPSGVAIRKLTPCRLPPLLTATCPPASGRELPPAKRPRPSSFIFRTPRYLEPVCAPCRTVATKDIEHEDACALEAGAAEPKPAPA